jgi:hypothetical protein
MKYQPRAAQFLFPTGREIERQPSVPMKVRHLPLAKLV